MPGDHVSPEPISLYGASKLTREGLCPALAGIFGFGVTLDRSANSSGGGGHYVVPCLLESIRDIPKSLEILRSRWQHSSHLHVFGRVDTMYVGAKCDGTRSNDTVFMSRAVEIVNVERWLDTEYTGSECDWGNVLRTFLSFDSLKPAGLEPRGERQKGGSRDSGGD